MKRSGYFRTTTKNGKPKVSREPRNEIIEYIRDLGMHIGHSTFRERTAGDVLRDEEYELSKRTTKAKQKQVYGKLVPDKYYTQEPTIIGLTTSCRKGCT